MLKLGDDLNIMMQAEAVENLFVRLRFWQSVKIWSLALLEPLVMLKSDLVRILSKRQPHLLPDDVALAVNCLLEQLMRSLMIGERIEIRGFGCFTLHDRPARVARNPKTGEIIQLTSRSAIRFKPGKEMRDRVNATRTHCRIKE